MGCNLAAVQHLKGLSGFDLGLDLRPVRLQVFDSYCLHSLNVYFKRSFSTSFLVVVFVRHRGQRAHGAPLRSIDVGAIVILLTITMVLQKQMIKGLTAGVLKY